MAANSPKRPDRSHRGMRRREFLQSGSASMLALGLAPLASARVSDAVSTTGRSCIFLALTGGPSQLDTWDMKPNAPSEIRGPYKPIKTNVSGIEISEIFPRTATMADKFAIVRSMHHEGEADHATGLRMLRPGRLSSPDVVLPRNHPSQDFALHSEPYEVRQRYGLNPFGQNCLQARRLVEAGARFVTVNMFDSVFHETTWDIHGSHPFSPMSCYSDRVGPMFDQAYSALLSELSRHGLLETTMVIASGEFGRTPKINVAGGRDHWPQCWSLLIAGGGVRGGQMIGSSDATASAPKDRPVSTSELAATIYHGLGLTPPKELAAEAKPVHELFA